jgi:hypothetical protein
MLTTGEVLDLLRKANPSANITEDKLRHAMRRPGAPAPSTFGGRLAWTEDDIVQVATAMKLTPPAFPPAAKAGAGTGGAPRRAGAT